LRALLEVAASPWSVPSATQVAFRSRPHERRGRMSTANDVIEMLLTHDADRARVLAERLHAFNIERQKTEADIVEAILDECERAPVDDTQPALVFCRRELAPWSARHRGSRLSSASTAGLRAERGSRAGPGQGRAQHSAVSSAGCSGIDAELFVKFGGTAMPPDDAG